MSVKVKFWKGAYWLFINHQGRRKSKRVGEGPQGKKAADQAAIQLQARLASGDDALFDERPPPQTLEAYVGSWMETHTRQACKFSTVGGYATNLRRHILPVLGSKPVGLLTRVDCRGLIAACHAKGLSPKTVENVCRTLSSVLTQAVEDGLLPANPALRQGRYLRRGDHVPPQICPLTDAEVHRLITTAAQQWGREHPLLLCAVRTGMRLGELLALQWGDIDFHGRFIVVRRNRVRGRTATPKSSKIRRVDMSPQLAGTLNALLVARKEETLRQGWREVPAWVFCNEEGRPQDGDNYRKRVFYRVLASAGLRRVRIHDLRHTFASLLLQRGANIKYIQEQLGHSSIQVTLDTYGHLIPGADRAAVDSLDDVTECNPGATGHKKGGTA
jgi:integrase